MSCKYIHSIWLGRWLCCKFVGWFVCLSVYLVELLVVLFVGWLVCLSIYFVGLLTILLACSRWLVSFLVCLFLCVYAVLLVCWLVSWVGCQFIGWSFNCFISSGIFFSVAFSLCCGLLCWLTGWWVACIHRCLIDRRFKDFVSYLYSDL